MGTLRSHLTTLLVIGCLRAASTTAAAAASPTGLPSELTTGPIAWGEETNGLRAGFAWERFPDWKLAVRVLLLNSRTNGPVRWVAPPGGQFAHIVLRDPQGRQLIPLRGKALESNLPTRFKTADLPHTKQAGHHASRLRDLLFVAPGFPAVFRDFLVEDAYRIEVDGDYTLTLWVAIYDLSADGKTASRLDLLPVSAKVHLVPTESLQNTQWPTAAILGGVAVIMLISLLAILRYRRKPRGTAPTLV